MGEVQHLLEQRLRTHFPDLHHLEVINESSGHAVPAGSETHFKIVIVSAAFENTPRLARHRAVQEAIREEMSAYLRAASIRPLSVSEWEKSQSTEPSPNCAGRNR